MIKITDDKALEIFEKNMREEGRSPNTIKNYLADIKHFQEFVGVHTGDGVSAAAQNTLKKFVQHLKKSGLAVSTINRRIQSLRTFYNVLIKEGYRSDNPLDGIKPLKVAKQNETKWLERHQVRAIFEAIDNYPQGEEKRVRDRAIISVLVNTGLRVSELCNLKLEHLDFENGIIEVTGKGSKYRKVPFPKASQKAVKRWLKYRDLDTPYLFHTERSPRITDRAVQHIAQKLSERLNFKFTVHQLRHTALKNIADATGKIEIVASVAGHEDVNTSKRYIEPSLAEIGAAMQQSEYDF